MVKLARMTVAFGVVAAACAAPDLTFKDDSSGGNAGAPVSASSVGGAGGSNDDSGSTGTGGATHADASNDASDSHMA